ncbi:hypothetical protein IE53DRAFT_377437 [Violaceomyces palustris]|uniref:Uncharacterized protein n=1 Tax=Violaceomyces palustris TaxID=1673888 RepID=A0ACD0P5G3_9BASI|nr:hypothetical protein IE53DRAFT_377437 [Violaceomyces palustris]
MSAADEAHRPSPATAGPHVSSQPANVESAALTEGTIVHPASPSLSQSHHPRDSSPSASRWLETDRGQPSAPSNRAPITSEHTASKTPSSPPASIRPRRTLPDEGQASSPLANTASSADVELANSPANPIQSDSSRHSTPATSTEGAQDEVKVEVEGQQSIDECLESIRPAYFYPIDPSSSSSSSSSATTNTTATTTTNYASSPGSADLLQEGVPVFHPTMDQFKDFYAFCSAIDKWGMKSGIVKVVPPSEWLDNLPSLKPDSAKPPTPAKEENGQRKATDQGGSERADLTSIRIRNAIMQHFTPAGSGVWRQTNVTRTVKVWNAKQWADTCISKGQKGPEMTRMKWKAEVDGMAVNAQAQGKDGSASNPAVEDEGVRTRSGKARASLTNSGSNGNSSHFAADSRSAALKRKRPDETSKRRREGRASGSEVADASRSRSGTPPPPSRDDVTGKDEEQDEGMPPLEPSPAAAAAAATTTANKLRGSEDGEIGKDGGAPLPPGIASSTPSSSPTKPKKIAWADTTSAEEWDKFDYKGCWLKEGLSHEELELLSWATTTDEKEDQGSKLPEIPPASSWNEATCREIESEYWRGLNFGKPPMYGADLKGTLFDSRTTCWNVGKLDNLLTRLRLKRKLPGVTTPYLYWGMWRATFAWHVEDMDLYSINYIHFGAPKQWYSIRQADRKRFESAMAGAFPADSRRCPHFMRHKSYLASPSFLASHGIRPLRLVHNAGEFVITYPYGYHSGFNMGFNCAESVNFALESWLEIGRKANYCHCDQAQQSVVMDVDAMLEESREMEEADKRKMERDEFRRMREEGQRAVDEQEKELEKKRKRNEKAREKRRLKRQAELAAVATGAETEGEDEADDAVDDTPFLSAVEAMTKASPRSHVSEGGDQPCIFCPSSIAEDLVLVPDPPSQGQKQRANAERYAHRLCASFIPETWVGKSERGDREVVCGYEGIERARFSLKCQICPTPALQKQGAKIQCTRGKCPRSAHVSCALIEEKGWFIDVCNKAVADRLEGKGDAASSSSKAGSRGKQKKKKSTQTTAQEPLSDLKADDEDHQAHAAAEGDDQRQAMVEDDEERLVVLCRSHNPLFKQAEEARKAAELREKALALAKGATIRVKSSGGVFEVTVQEVRDLKDGQGDVMVLDQGRLRSVKWGRIMFETKEKVEGGGSGSGPEDGAEDEDDDGLKNAAKRRKKEVHPETPSVQEAPVSAKDVPAAVVKPRKAPAPKASPKTGAPPKGSKANRASVKASTKDLEASYPSDRISDNSTGAAIRDLDGSGPSASVVAAMPQPAAQSSSCSPGPALPSRGGSHFELYRQRGVREDLSSRHSSVEVGAGEAGHHHQHGYPMYGYAPGEVARTLPPPSISGAIDHRNPRMQYHHIPYPGTTPSSSRGFTPLSTYGYRQTYSPYPDPRLTQYPPRLPNQHASVETRPSQHQLHSRSPVLHHASPASAQTLPSSSPSPHSQHSQHSHHHHHHHHHHQHHNQHHLQPPTASPSLTSVVTQLPASSSPSHLHPQSMVASHPRVYSERDGSRECFLDGRDRDWDRERGREQRSSVYYPSLPPISASSAPGGPPQHYPSLPTNFGPSGHPLHSPHPTYGTEMSHPMAGPGGFNAPTQQGSGFSSFGSGPGLAQQVTRIPPSYASVPQYYSHESSHPH